MNEWPEDYEEIEGYAYCHYCEAVKGYRIEVTREVTRWVCTQCETWLDLEIHDFDD